MIGRDRPRGTGHPARETRRPACGHLRTLRQEAGLSRAELARRARLPVSTLRHWGYDWGFPYLAAVLRLAEALGVSVERIAEGVDDPAEEEPEPAQEKSLRPRKGKMS